MADPKIKERIGSLGGCAARLAGGLRPNYRGRHREVGQGRAVLWRARELNRACAPGRRVPHETRLKPFFAFDETIFPFPRLNPPSQRVTNGRRVAE
jgi:hypothetical protein